MVRKQAESLPTGLRGLKSSYIWLEATEETQGPAHSWRWTPSTAERPRLVSAQSIHSKHPRHRTSSSEHPRTAAAPPSPHATTTAKHIRTPRTAPTAAGNAHKHTGNSARFHMAQASHRASSRVPTKDPGFNRGTQTRTPATTPPRDAQCTRTSPPAGGQKSSAHGRSLSTWSGGKERHRAFRPDAMPPAARRGPMHTTRALEHGTRPRANDLVRTQRRPRSCGA